MEAAPILILKRWDRCGELEEIAGTWPPRRFAVPSSRKR
jgi:hypothetical protein